MESVPGQGSVFTLTIPVSLGEPDRESLAPQSDSSKCVLLIDDDETFRYVLRQIVGNESRYEFIEADGGEEGLKLAREKRPDVIILDLQMPTVDGFTVLQQLGADERTSAIPVVVSTSMTIDADAPLAPARSCPADLQERDFPRKRLAVPARRNSELT